MHDTLGVRLISPEGNHMQDTLIILMKYELKVKVKNKLRARYKEKLFLEFTNEEKY
jgi:hypothetical protein